MKAIKSEKLDEITQSPENREKFRKFIATRSSASGQFVTTRGTSTIVEFVVGKSTAAR